MLPIGAFKISLITMDQFSFNILKGKEIYRLDSCEYPSIFGFNIIEADPFLFVYNNRLYLFYESLAWGEKGIIKMVYTDDLINWSSPKTVLKEICHLSYPFVFLDEKSGSVYMMPETCQMNEVRLYKANNDLTNFFFYKTILTDSNASQISYSDSSLICIDNIYYLHTTRQEDDKNILELYFSPNFDGNFIEHPLSPIVQNLKYGRNGGSLFFVGDRLYRPAQNCANGYGNDLGILEVDKISPQEYKEHIVNDNIYHGQTLFYKDGGHHLNMVYFRNKYVIATDAKVYKKYFFNRLVDKIFK